MKRELGVYLFFYPVFLFFFTQSTLFAQIPIYMLLEMKSFNLNIFAYTMSIIHTLLQSSK